MTQNKRAQTLSRLKLLVLAAFFFGPLVAAWVLYYGFPEVAPNVDTSSGQLIDPARPLPEKLGLTSESGEPVSEDVFQDRRWTLLFYASESCDQACSERLYDTRQVRTALHKRAPRVQRMYIATEPQFLPDESLIRDTHPDLELYIDSANIVGDFLNGTVDNAGSNGDVYLLDPLGNWLLYYRPKDPAKGMLEDLKRLLKLSHIG